MYSFCTIAISKTHIVAIMYLRIAISVLLFVYLKIKS